jgi:hypothetical protein
LASRLSKSIVVITAVLLCGASSGLVAAAAPTLPDEELEEALVSGRKLHQLRADVIAAEDRFYELFNELNTNDDYDVHCTQDQPTGTRISHRACRPVFYARAQEDEARSLLNELQGFAAAVVPSPQVVALERNADMTRSMLEVINKDPRLVKLVRERERLEKRYVAERKKRMKGRLIRFN